MKSKILIFILLVMAATPVNAGDKLELYEFNKDYICNDTIYTNVPPYPSGDILLEFVGQRKYGYIPPGDHFKILDTVLSVEGKVCYLIYLWNSYNVWELSSPPGHPDKFIKATINTDKYGDLFEDGKQRGTVIVCWVVAKSLPMLKTYVEPKLTKSSSKEIFDIAQGWLRTSLEKENSNLTYKFSTFDNSQVIDSIDNENDAPFKFIFIVKGSYVSMNWSGHHRKYNYEMLVMDNGNGRRLRGYDNISLVDEW